MSLHGISDIMKGTSVPFSTPADMTKYVGKDGSVVDITQYIKVVQVDVSEHAIIQHSDDQQWKHYVRHQLAKQLAEEALNHTRFTQAKDPLTYSTRVYGRLVIMSDTEFKKLIGLLR